MKRKKLKEQAKRIYRDHGDALEAHKVIAQARDISRIVVSPGTSEHKIQEFSLRENVLCVIDRPFSLVESALKLKE